MSDSRHDEIFTTWTRDLEGENVSVVYLCGELDASSAPGFLTDIQQVVHSGKDIVMDAHLLSYTDSTGVSAILSTKRALEKMNRKFSIAGVHGLLSKILKVTRIDNEIDCYEDVDAAVKAMSGNQSGG